jgi:hypothetical protein
MFMAGFSRLGRGDVHTGYFDGAVSDAHHLKMYVCAFAVGHFVFEVVAHVTRGITRIDPRNQDFNSLAVALWPVVERGFVWPRAGVLKTVRDFDLFSLRWQGVDVKLL